MTGKKPLMTFARMHGVGKKQCGSCHKIKMTSQYKKVKSTRSACGYVFRGDCNECTSEFNKKYYLKVTKSKRAKKIEEKNA